MEHETVDDILVVTLPTRLDAAGLEQIEGPFSELVQGRGGKVLVDMSQVQFLASLALRMLITNLKELQAANGDLRLCGLQPPIAEIFRKTRFNTLFKIYVDRAAALDKFA
jgi:anti-sigma B factor antagonist